MDERPLSEWTEKELAERERSYPRVDPTYGLDLAAEINRRRARKSQRYVLASVIIAAVSAFGSMVAAIVSLISLYVKK
jgi:hypothetical protein